MLDGNQHLIVTLRIENVGAAEIYVPLSSDQARVHAHGMKTRYTAVIAIHRPAADAAHIMDSVIDELYGSQSSPGSLFRLGPGKAMSLKVKGSNPGNGITPGSKARIELSMALLEDDHFNEYSRSATVVSLNSSETKTSASPEPLPNNSH